MKLTYWYARCLDGHNCYSVREKTKKAAKAYLDINGVERFGRLTKVEIEYADGLDLLTMALGEGGVYQEPIDGP